MKNEVTINKYLPIAILYFFFNSFLLPHGLLYTAILTPLFILWLLKYSSVFYLVIFFLLTLPFVYVHISNGVHLPYYIKSYLLLFTVYVFCVAFYQFAKVCTSIRSLFRQLLLINVFFLFIALVALFIPALVDRFWYVTQVTSRTVDLPRLKMLSYEPSYYSILFVPIVMYYYLKIFLLKGKNVFLVLLLTTVPLLLSLSFGIILGLVLALVFLFISDVKLFSLRQRVPFYFLVGIALIMVSFIVILKVYPDNLFFVRMANVFEGRDNSFKGRTFDSFYLGWKIAAEKSLVFGSGPGQTKLIGLEFFKEFYNQPRFVNSVGDTLAVFGLLGVFIRLAIELYFFFTTRVYLNFYRLGLFIFVFIYQFTGSFLTNIAEYVIWILAFSPHVFKEFDKVEVYKFNSNIALKP
jgi:hypothetical protein